MMRDDQQTYLPSAAVRARYGVSDMSLWRWLHDETLGFPAPVRIQRRRYWKLDELKAWEATRKQAKSGSQEVAHASAA
jgi:predicted DNA-binding transcriptional regulator AlpA